MLAPHDPLPPEVVESLRRGNAVDAIARLRARGLGFQEATRRIRDHLRKQASTAGDLRWSRQLPPDAAQALARGDKIGAIKLVRAETGLGLKEAKDWVEARAPTVLMPTGLSPGQVPRHEGLVGWIFVLLVIAAGAYFWFAR